VTFFACAIQTDGGPVPESFRAAIERARFCQGKQMGWHSATDFLAVVDLNEGGAGPAVARVGSAISVGAVRLDNCGDVRRWTGCGNAAISDLELATRFVIADDGARIDELLGDFAFVVWDSAAKRLVATCDTFSIRKIYHAGPRRGLLTFSSRAELLATGDEYDVQYLADRIAHCNSEPERTVYPGVRAVPPAGVLRLRHGMPVVRTYWSASEAQAAGDIGGSPQDQCEAFRALLIEAVRLRLTDGPYTWSHLSGGLDSSSIVSVAQWLDRLGAIPNGLAGTITHTDSLGTDADEKEYSDAVVQHYGVRNELVPHHVDRRDILRDPPLLDQPNRPYPAVARDRVAARVIQQAGGRVLLTGAGGDSLVMGTMFFFADWVAAGRVWQAAREMARRAALGRASFWELAYQNAVLPLMPAQLRRKLTRSQESPIPPWVAPAARRFQLAARTARSEVYGGRLGHKYADAVAATIAANPSALPLGPLDDELDLRHPYFYRPLVELALQLSPEMCVRPHARKWVLREAMRGILPEVVRTRVGKGGADGLDAWSLVHEQQLLGRMLHDPILAQLGCIDPSKLRDTLEAVRRGRAGHDVLHNQISGTLEVEMWLQLRSGRWAAEDSQTSSAQQYEVA